LIDTSIAPDTAHESVEEEPVVMVDGIVVNEAITGAATALTETVTVAVVLPPALVAVRV
jgi:hypothetical protein